MGENDILQTGIESINRSVDEDDQTVKESCPEDLKKLCTEMANIKISPDCELKKQQKAKECEERVTANFKKSGFVKDTYSNQEISSFSFGCNPVRAICSEIHLPLVIVEPEALSRDAKTVDDILENIGKVVKEPNENGNGRDCPLPKSKCDEIQVGDSEYPNSGKYKMAELIADDYEVAEAYILEGEIRSVRRVETKFLSGERVEPVEDTVHVWPCHCTEKCVGKRAPEWKKDERTWLWKSERQRLQAYELLKKESS